MPELPELFFDVWRLLLPSYLLSQGGIAFAQGLEALMGFDASDDGLEFIRGDPLAIVLTRFPTL